MKPLLILLFAPCFAIAQVNSAFVVKSNLSYTKLESSGDGMFGFEQNGKIGYLDVKGNVVIPAIHSYDSSSLVSPPSIPGFFKGYAIVVKNKKKGLMDKAGKLIIPIEYDN